MSLVSEESWAYYQDWGPGQLMRVLYTQLNSDKGMVMPSSRDLNP